MTAFQPNPDAVTAQDQLGGLRPEMTPQRKEVLGALGLQIESPRLAAREDAGAYFRQEFNLSGHVTDMPDDVRSAMHRVRQGLRDKTLPGMANDPARHIEVVETPEQQGARILREAQESWDEIEAAGREGRLF